MKNLLIICKTPYGKLTDVVKWCENLPKDYRVTVISLKNETGLPVTPSNVKVIEMPIIGSYSIRGALYVLISLFYILLHRGPVLVEYFSGCAIFKQLMPWKNMILDVRTLAVWGNQDDRDKYDSKLRETARAYNKLVVISEGVGKRLGDVGIPTYELPLGSDVISTKNKIYDTLKLIYVGTFMDRDIDKTVKGVEIFHTKHPDVPISYDIIGDGHPGELEKYKNYAKELDISNIVTFHGRVSHDKLGSYFDNSNIGVSYVPITPFFDIQPVTKTFEYAMSGLYVIGTATEENKKVMTPNCGVLINDTPEEFCVGLERIWTNRTNINEEKVRSALSQYEWKKLVERYLMPILNDKTK